MPDNDIFGSAGNEADTATNPDTVNEYGMVDFTGQGSLSQTGSIPAPRDLPAEGSS